MPLLAELLGQFFIRREFIIQRLLIGAARSRLLGQLLLLFVFGGVISRSAQVVQVVLFAVGMLCWAVAAGFAVVGLLHLAGAAERDQALRDEVLEEAIDG